jgi:hypothetical protein
MLFHARRLVCKTSEADDVVHALDIGHQWGSRVTLTISDVKIVMDEDYLYRLLWHMICLSIIYAIISDYRLWTSCWFSSIAWENEKTMSSWAPP